MVKKKYISKNKLWKKLKDKNFLFFGTLIASLAISIFLYVKDYFVIKHLIIFNVILLVALVTLFYSKTLYKKIKNETISFAAMLISLTIALGTYVKAPIEQTAFSGETIELIKSGVFPIILVSLVSFGVFIICLIVFLIFSRKRKRRPK